MNDQTNNPTAPQPAEKSRGGCLFSIIGILLGGLIGGISGISLPLLYFAFMNPPMLHDGQTAFILVYTVPGFAALGAIAGLMIANWKHSSADIKQSKRPSE